MRTRLLTLLLPIACLLAALPVRAQDGLKQFTITPVGGITQFDDTYEMKTNAYAGLRLGWQFYRYLGIEAAGGWTPTKMDRALEEKVNWYHASGNLMITPLPDLRVSPFGFVGVGAERFDVKRQTLSLAFPRLDLAGTEESDDHLAADAGVGVLIKITDAIGLRLEGRNVLWVPKNDMQKADMNQMVGLAGLTFGFGGKVKDTDLDGVPDKKDKCPNTPTGATVDATGCPKDSDGDGVLDGLDQCPNTPKGAKVNAKGCPTDADGDGVWDGIDQCADTPKGAKVDAKGCPTDSDGDGVWDGIDECTNTLTGCTVDAKGCPTDSDGDGVCDGLDKCVNTPKDVKVDKDGCPIEVMEKETELLDTGTIRLENVNFETAKADLLPESLPVLDIVGNVLERWPDLKIEIGGHTDSRGKDAYNQKLSEARAKSVLDYLLQHHPALKADQYTVKGYGESKPLVPNTNALNMAKNRRVEFVVQNKDVLKKEIERRKLLPK